VLDEIAEQVLARVRAARIAVAETGRSPDSFALQEALGSLDELHATERIFASTPDDIAYARAYLQSAGALPHPHDEAPEGDLVGAGR
jgi:sulfate permease, SulP family